MKSLIGGQQPQTSRLGSRRLNSRCVVAVMAVVVAVVVAVVAAVEMVEGCSTDRVLLA